MAPPFALLTLQPRTAARNVSYILNALTVHIQMSCEYKQVSEWKVLLGLFKPSPAGNSIYKETVII